MRGGGRLGEGASAEQRDCVSQQTCGPTELQAIKKIVTEPKLMLVVRLGGFDPRAALIEEPLGYLAVGRNCSIKDFVFAGRVRELFRAIALLPAAGAERFRIQHAKPVKLIARLQSKPVQRLALLTSHACRCVKRVRHDHVGPPFGDDCHLEAFAHSPVHGQVDVGHVANDNVGCEIQSIRAVAHARL